MLTEQRGAWFYKPNLGGGRVRPLRAVARRCRSGGRGRRDRPQLLDLAGDGQLDLVDVRRADAGLLRAHRRRRLGAVARRSRALPDGRLGRPDLRFVDLDGDGHADVLSPRGGAHAGTRRWARHGFGAARSRVAPPLDEEPGPRLVFADGTGSVHLADMSGDGLADLVRIRNGEVCYWPNLGYGRFGAQVVMDDAPWFDRAERSTSAHLGSPTSTAPAPPT